MARIWKSNWIAVKLDYKAIVLVTIEQSHFTNKKDWSNMINFTLVESLAMAIWIDEILVRLLLIIIIIIMMIPENFIIKRCVEGELLSDKY